MELRTSTGSSVPVLYLKGRFDAHEVAPVREWIKTHIDAGQVQLCINLAEVNFVDSSALSVLVQGLKHCREKGGDLVLCCLPQVVRVIFELTRLDKAIRIFATEEEAIQA